MKRILIADSNKASLVITSEVFKDHFPGVQVVVTRSSAETLDIVRNDTTFDAIVIDYDLADRDGAQTAAKIKRMVQTPILLTGYDDPEVQDHIETELAGYDDCLSWLRKPVKPELVVQIVQRYCEGKYRTQRRIPCAVPALLEVAVSLPPAKTPAAKNQVKKVATKKKTVKASGNPTSSPEIRKMWLPALIEDCSLGGLKLRLNKDKIGLVSLPGPATKALNGLKAGEVLTLQLPSWEQIERNEPLSHQDLTEASYSRKQAALSGRAAKGKEPGVETKPAKLAPLPTLRLRIAWTSGSIETQGWLFGMQSENAAVSKKLFDLSLAILHKDRH